ncbi:MAG: hypothetical protein GY937_22870 [bacterium]|nr:hypothetical protein [bacterium]
MAHYTQITAAVSLLAPSGDLTAPTAATLATPTTQEATFDLRIAKELLEATELGDDFRQYAQGVGEWDGTITFHYDADAVATGQDELLECILSADFGGTLASAGQIQVNFWIDAEAGAGASKAYYGAVFVEDFNISVGRGLSTMTVRVRGNGTPKYSGVLL